MDEFDMEDEDAYEGEDLGYVDPEEMVEVGRSGPTRAAAAAGDINYQSAPFQEYETRQTNAIQALRDARSRAVQALRPTDDKSRYLALAAGFLAPTRTGGFGENVSNALTQYLPYKQQQRQDELGYQGALSKYDMDLAQAEYEQSMKPPTFTDIYQGGGKQKVMIVNGKPYPVGGIYTPRGATGPLAKIQDIEKMTPAQRALYEKYGMPKAMQMSIELNENKDFGKRLGFLEAEDYQKLQQAGLAAPVKIANYQRLGSLLSQLPTGKFRGTINEISKAMETVGWNPASLGIDANTTVADAANAMGREMALQLRNPAGGAGMPGALSDSDRKFLESMVPGLETTSGAIPMMVDWQVRIAKRDQEVARIARQYRKDHNGEVDEGFYDTLQAYSEAHPLFTDADREAINKLGAGEAETPPPSAAAPKSLEELNLELKELGGHIEIGADGTPTWVKD